MRPPFAYVFERFPSFTQTFCVREVLELRRQGIKPLLFSIHDTSDEDIRHFPEELRRDVITLPQGEALVEEVKTLKSANLLPQKAVLTLRHWGEKPDKRRVHEAAWIGHQLAAAGVRHAHAHFGGLAARTCWWLKEFHAITYSFTGHANDILCPDPFEVSRQKLIDDAAVVVTVSDFTARHLRKTYGGGRKIKRVYNGLDLEPIIGGIGSRKKEQPPLILSVGRLTPKKGFSDLIAACAILREQRREFRCEITGTGELEDDLTARIQSAGLNGTVTLTGPKPMAWIIDRLHESSLFALACATEEDGGMDNLPTVIMEAMAAALPCVSTRLAGVPEMVVDGETGLLVPEKNPQALASAIARLLDHPEEAARFGQAGLTRAKALFDQKVTARHLLRSLVSRGKVRLPAGKWLTDPALVLAKLAR
ncbi:MAG: glycosyltransferase family 4 protein [Verrucomicrobiales bacterium]